jgi:6-phosphogluconate dehydrogenase
MQLIAEAYVLLRDVAQLTHAEMSATFKSWNQTELASYLIEITADILVKQDEHSAHPLVEMILDKAGQKGTGRWSSEAALEVGIPTPTITSAVFARALSALKDERLVAAELLTGPGHQTIGNKEDFVGAVKDALLGSIIASYAQGLAVISAASAEHHWQVDIATVASIWRAGCIIRADLLDTITSAYRQSGQPLNLMCASGISNLLQKAQHGWRKTLVTAIESGIPVPAISSALAYYDSYRSPRLWANMIQAQRDYFGAHTYQRVDREGVFHSQW